MPSISKTIEWEAHLWEAHLWEARPRGDALLNYLAIAAGTRLPQVNLPQYCFQQALPKQERNR